MFWSISEQARKDLEELKNVLETNERIRNILAAAVTPLSEVGALAELLAAQSTAPSRPAWVLYDHCAAVTRMYAIFEGSIDSVVKEYLAALPAIYPSYRELPPPVANQHRIGVAQILTKLGDRGLYKHLSEQDALRGISSGLAGEPYVLLVDAFLTDTQNYRSEQINTTFAYLNLADIWAGVEKHPALLDFMSSRDSTETPRTILNQLVVDRNLAAHSIVTQTLSVQELVALADFLQSVIVAICAIARKQCVLLECGAGLRKELFSVTNLYKGGALGGKFLNGELTVGDQLIAIGREGAFRVEVMSIQNGALVLNTATSSTYKELGLKLSVPVAKKTTLVSLHSHLVSSKPVRTVKTFTNRQPPLFWRVVRLLLRRRK